MDTVHTPRLDLQALSSRYVAMLEASEIPDPLLQRITVAAVIADLLTLAGMPLTPDVESALARLQ